MKGRKQRGRRRDSEVRYKKYDIYENKGWTKMDWKQYEKNIELSMTEEEQVFPTLTVSHHLSFVYSYQRRLERERERI